MKNQPIVDHERLDVYQVELSFVTWAADLLGRDQGRAYCLIWRGLRPVGPRESFGLVKYS